MKFLKTTICIAIITFSIQCFAQNKNSYSDYKNSIKLNLMSGFFNSISIQHERIRGKKISTTLGLRVTPGVNLDLSPFLGKEDKELEPVFKKSRLTTFAITKELRYYMGKTVGKGFYVGPMIRVEKSKLVFDIGAISGNAQSLKMSGSILSFSGGLQTGFQFPIGKHFLIDWWTAGASIGYSQMNANMSSSNFGFAEKDIQDMNKILQQPDGGILNKEKTSVSNQEINITTNFHSAFSFRTGLCIGYRF